MDDTIINTNEGARIVHEILIVLWYEANLMELMEILFNSAESLI